MLAPLPAKKLAGYIEAVPLQRMGTPEEVASMIAYLASDEAAYITGQTIRVDGGLLMA
jgi:NAD(P)-dependent dehydrogenase (short-subunit alcohol dehydrogenase family)